jgi:hypothetical protein
MLRYRFVFSADGRENGWCLLDEDVFFAIISLKEGRDPH